MGKLVLHLPDGSTRDIPLTRERTTIGRRPDNDICLPLPTVSGEHAAVVTVLDDSFLEDLGSRNGTLVNGKEIRKHFLRDRDEIDIGRQRLVYVSGQGETVDTGEPVLSRTEAEAPAVVRVRERAASPRGDTAAALAPAGADAAGGRGEAPHRATIDTSTLFAPPPQAAAPTGEAVARGVAPRLEVLDGRQAGAVVPLDGDELVLGRLGVQLAAIRRRPDGHWLFALEGDAAPAIDGTPLPAEGALLAPGAEVVIAGTRVRYRSGS